MTYSVLLGLLLLAALLIWRRWHQVTHEQHVDLSTLGAGLAGVIASLAIVVVESAGVRTSSGPWPFLGTVAAVAGAAGLAVVSYRITAFRSGPGGLRYRSDIRIGLPVFGALILALALKAAQIYEAVRIARAIGASSFDAAIAALDPLTTIVIAFTAAYLGWYGLFVFRRAWQGSDRRHLLLPR